MKKEEFYTLNLNDFPLLPEEEELIDTVFATSLIQEAGEAREFVARLFMASRVGHLCLPSRTHPLPDSIVTEITPHFVGVPMTPICREGDLYYLQKNWVYESQVKRHLSRLLHETPSLTLAQPEKTSTLNTRQQSALKQALEQSLTLITGGPGTGKTYTAGNIVQALYQADESINICLAAPTGKAAAHLHRSMAPLLDKRETEPQTLHRLLGVGKRNAPQRLQEDVILVDESSMIDVRLMAELFSKIKSGARLILLGDKDQLPPVEAGSLFADLVRKLGKTPHVVELDTCLRTELEEIVSFSKQVNRGDPEALSKLKASGAVYRLPYNSLLKPHLLQDLLLNTVEKHFCSIIPQDLKPESYLAAFDTFRVLSPLRKGLFGVEELNEKLHARLVKHKQENRPFAVPIMITANDYRLDLYNGETGVLFLDGEKKRALFPSRDKKESLRQFPLAVLKQYTYAYCLSVHKSQGSEFDHVLLVMPNGAEAFGREVFYTAATRAKRQLGIFGEDETLLASIKRHFHRFSGLAPQ